MTIEATYHGEVRVVRSSYTSKTGPTLTLALHDIDELNKVQGMDGKRYMLALAEIGDDELPVQVEEKPKGGALSILAGMWCADKRFWRWAFNQFDVEEFSKPEDAAKLIRDICKVQSRAELDHNQSAQDRFQRIIRAPYMTHLATHGGINEIAK